MNIRRKEEGKRREQERRKQGVRGKEKRGSIACGEKGEQREEEERERGQKTPPNSLERIGSPVMHAGMFVAMPLFSLLLFRRLFSFLLFHLIYLLFLIPLCPFSLLISGVERMVGRKTCAD